MAPKKMTEARETDDSIQIKNTYKKLSQLEHVLSCPSMYVGSTSPDNYLLWVYDEASDQNVKRDVCIIPGLYKIVDEVFVNAMDHGTRMIQAKNKNENSENTIHLVKNVKVNICKETGEITVFNDGSGIEIVVHPEHDIYIPELIFGNLLTSTNYNKDEIRTIGGQNGIGAKACNILSEWFEITTVDARRKLMYTQMFKSNMKEVMKPSIKKCSNKPFTKIRFLPDYKRFGGGTGGIGGTGGTKDDSPCTPHAPHTPHSHTHALSNDMYSILMKRSYDLCALTPPDVNVFVNDTKPSCKNFEKYVDMFLGPKDEKWRCYEAINERWEIVVSCTDAPGFDHISYVNGIWTMKGGKHVDYISNQVANKLCDLIKKKKKIADVKASHIKNYMMIFVKATIDNPTFDSQTKEYLTTPVSKFGSTAVVSDKLIDKLFKSEIMDRVLNLCDKSKQMLNKKTDGKKQNKVRGLAKLDDANWAGTAKSKECVLILTEGDSAKTMALVGLSEVGRDRYGVFPLRGKLMNVKDASEKKMVENKEIQDIKKILGLESGKKYKSVDELRYGRIMIMTDQDSVTGDTPLLLRHGGRVSIETIENLCNDYQSQFPGGKEYGNSDINFEVWTEKGWTFVRRIMRHKVNKRIFRVLTPMGVVDVTEDHSLLKPSGEEVTPNECEIDDMLLHSFPDFEESRYMTQDTITIDEASVIGQYWALGGYQTNTILPLLNSSFGVRKSFLDGLLLTNIKDENKNENDIIDIESKINAQCIYYLAKSLKYGVSINHKPSDGNEKYRLTLTRDQESHQNRIKKIWNLGVTDQYVYDLETENHHFQAGIGQMIVHNTDGSHIRGLIMNMFHTLWPSLLVQPDFICSMLTPIVKTFKGKISNNFYNLTDYQKWLTSTPNVKDWKIKYYKGLGTSNDEEAKDYFRDMYMIHYDHDGAINVDKVFDLAFNKKKADDRKGWIGQYDAQNIIEVKTNEENHVTRITFKDFIDKELIHFSNYDVMRSIPSVMDGFKPSQRKIYFACEKRNLVSEIKVSQLAGYVSEHAAYHHGEASLQGAIVGMAQDFPGSNNMPILMANGMFGSRNMGGKDAAQPRYIFTQLNAIAPKLFIKDDAKLLKYLDDDGYPVEPEYYMPIIPFVLVNGATGIGTGYSTSVPHYNPSTIIKVLKHCIQNDGSIDEEHESLLKPWFRGFTGEVREIPSTKKSKSYSTHGVYKQLSNTSVEITELPIGTWTEDYKEFLESYLAQNPDVLKDIESHSAKNVRFVLHFSAEGLKRLMREKEGEKEEEEKGGNEDGDSVASNSTSKSEIPSGLEIPPGFELPSRFETEFKLVSRNISTTNMHLFDADGVIKRYDTVKDIILDFYRTRLAYYVKRKQFNVDDLKKQMTKANAKALFIKEVMDGVIEIMGRRREDVNQTLVERKYPKVDGNHTYLLSMPIYTFTKEKYEDLLKDVKDLEDLLAAYINTTESSMWLSELDALDVEYKKQLDLYDDLNRAQKVGSNGEKNKNENKRKRSTGSTRSKAASNKK